MAPFRMVPDLKLEGSAVPIKLRIHEGNRTDLVALCDVCGNPVRGDLANILWPEVLVEQVGDTVDPGLLKTIIERVLKNLGGS